jgi:hypothetical protein
MSNYPMSLADIQYDVLNRLSEGKNSPAGQFTTGVGGSPAIDTLTTITQLFNSTSADFCRTAYPIEDVATITLAANAMIVPFNTMVTVSGHTIWSALAVKFGSTPLRYVDRSVLNTYHPSWQTDASGTPVMWFKQGIDGIGLYPRPISGGSVLTVEGYALPKPLKNGADLTALSISGATNANPVVVTAAGHGLSTGQFVYIAGIVGTTAANGYWPVVVTSSSTFSLAGSVGNGSYVSGGTVADVPTWFDPDLVKYPIYRTCALLAEKNTQRADLAQRAQIWMAEYDNYVKERGAIMWRNDPNLALAHFPRMG